MLINNAKLIDNFKRLASEDKLSHAYLFFGGDEDCRREKFIFARCLANFLENGIFEEPRRPLREALVILPDEKKTIGIDSVRELKYFLWQKPINSKYRLAIVEGAENLTPEAQNAVLKIVEEPPESALIIFISNIEDNLLPALNSRLQKIYFSRPAATKTATDGHMKSSIEEIIENKQVDEFLESLIRELRKSPIKNSKRLKEVLNKLTLMKQFNVNKKLQLKALLIDLA